MQDNSIFLIGEVGTEITLQSVIDKVSQTNQAEPLNVHIHSGGGSVYDGLAIYNYLKELPQGVNTKSSGLVASIASVIFLAGNKATRRINSTDNFLIHLPMAFGGGNAKDFEKTGKELRDIENKIADIYVKETNITKDEVIELMNRDEMLDVEFLKEKGFVSDIIKFQAVASINKNNNMDKQVTKEDVENIFQKFAKLFTGTKKEPVNIMLQDSNGQEIEFPDVMEGETPEVGDKAVIEGVPVPDGEYIMPSLENATVVFAGGMVSEIKPEESEAEDNTEKLNEEIDSLKDTIQNYAEAEAEKDKVIANLETKVGDMESAFTELKNQVTGNFDYDKKDKKKTNEPVNKSRSLFKD